MKYGMKKRYTIDDEWDGARIDRFIRAVSPGTPFAVIQTLLRKGGVTLNGRTVGGGDRLAAGDSVEIHEQINIAGRAAAGTRGGKRPDETPVGVEKWGSIGREIPVLFEDDDVLVIDKSHGLIVQPGNRKDLGSLLDLLEAYQIDTGERSERGTPPGKKRTPSGKRLLPAENPKKNKGRDEKRDTQSLPAYPFTPVHRLDRETTGVLIAAKTRSAARALSGAFRKGQVEKVYMALVEGAPSPGTGTVTAPLRVEKGRRSTARRDTAGKRSETRYRTVRTVTGGRTLLEVCITTGRTHQIRVHLAGIGHPIVGDRRYGKKHEERGRKPYSGNILCLHAWKVIFPHPRHGDAVEVTAPPPSWARGPGQKP
jgi:23S rRNA pseudouridine955/2504/2580 synthase